MYSNLVNKPERAQDLATIQVVRYSNVGNPRDIIDFDISRRRRKNFQSPFLVGDGVKITSSGVSSGTFWASPVFKSDYNLIWTLVSFGDIYIQSLFPQELFTEYVICQTVKTLSSHVAIDAEFKMFDLYTLMVLIE